MALPVKQGRHHGHRYIEQPRINPFPTRLGAPVGTGAPKRRVDEDYTVVAAAGDSSPAMADVL
jgi:hypothetical protein